MCASGDRDSGAAACGGHRDGELSGGVFRHPYRQRQDPLLFHRGGGHGYGRTGALCAGLRRSGGSDHPSPPVPEQRAGILCPGGGRLYGSDRSRPCLGDGDGGLCPRGRLCEYGNRHRITGGQRQPHPDGALCGGGRGGYGPGQYRGDHLSRTGRYRHRDGRTGVRHVYGTLRRPRGRLCGVFLPQSGRGAERDGGSGLGGRRRLYGGRNSGQRHGAVHLRHPVRPGGLSAHPGGNRRHCRSDGDDLGERQPDQRRNQRLSLGRIGAGQPGPTGGQAGGLHRDGARGRHGAGAPVQDRRLRGGGHLPGHPSPAGFPVCLCGD